MSNQIILVCGGRDYVDFDILSATLDALHSVHPISLIVHGGARGADELSGQWAGLRGIPYRVYQANWNVEGKRAGPMRNQRMLDDAKPDLVVAFPGGRGTADMIRRAKLAGVSIVKGGSRELQAHFYSNNSAARRAGY